MGGLSNGTWNLRVNDNGPGDTGTLESWSVTLVHGCTRYSRSREIA
ncbi:proprotein convertase P-domain-containing protein [Tahibacter amnicola]